MLHGQGQFHERDAYLFRVLRVLCPATDRQEQCAFGHTWWQLGSLNISVEIHVREREQLMEMETLGTWLDVDTGVLTWHLLYVVVTGACNHTCFHILALMRLTSSQLNPVISL